MPTVLVPLKSRFEKKNLRVSNLVSARGSILSCKIDTYSGVSI